MTFPLLFRPMTDSVPDHLQASVRIGVQASGTVIGVRDGIGPQGQPKFCAYVLSTGHLSLHTDFYVYFFYCHGQLRRRPLACPARLLVHVGHSNQGVDFSLLEVELPGQHEGLRHVPLGRNVPFGKECVSVGCPRGEPPCVYEAKPQRWSAFGGDFLVDIDGMVPGRSGGGLFHEGKLVGVAWGYDTKEKVGLFTAPQSIMTILAVSQFGFLLP